MKKIQINAKFKQSIRQDGAYYCLSDLHKCVIPAMERFDPWKWAQSENITRDISRRGWFFKTYWGNEYTLLRYAKYLSPGLYQDAQRTLDIIGPRDLIARLGQTLAVRLDERAARIVKEDREEREERQQAEETIRLKKERRNRQAEDMKRALQSPRSMSHSRSMGQSVTHHRSEPDYLTQALLVQSLSDNWDSSSHRSHDVCSTPSHSDSHSWSGDSGGSYDSGSSGGCGD